MPNLSFVLLISWISINSTKIFTQPNNPTSIVKTSLPISPTPSPPNPPIPNPDGHLSTNNSCAMITEFGFPIPMIFSSEFSSISTTIYYLATTVKARLWGSSEEIIPGLVSEHSSRIIASLVPPAQDPRHRDTNLTVIFGNHVPIPEKHWNSISIDFIEHLPLSSGYTSILVVIDRLTKQAIFISTHDTITSQELAQLFVIHVFSKHGIPSHVTSDRGVEFFSHFFRSLGKALNMKLHFTSGYHPEGDGQTERTNQTLEQYLQLSARQLV